MTAGTTALASLPAGPMPVQPAPRRSAGRPGRWLLRPPSGDAAARLFCFPYAGTGASVYGRWPRRIGSADLCLVQAPARENRLREPHYGSYQAFARDLAACLQPYLDRPFAFFGHCAGATAAFETARYLAEAGLPGPARLFVSAQAAPHEGPCGSFLQMSDAQLTQALGRLARAAGGEPSPALAELGLEVMRADLDAHRSYVLAAPVRLPCPVTVLSWRDDDVIPPAMTRGWLPYGAAGQVRFATVAGGHYSFLSAPDELLAELAADLAGDLAGLGHGAGPQSWPQADAGSPR